jgi:hypothetical protein
VIDKPPNPSSIAAILDFGTNGFDPIIRVIQSSLTPIFLLTAIASLLGVFTTRLARIADLVHALSDRPIPDEEKDRANSRLSFLHRRTLILDGAVILAAIAGASTCGTALALFLGLLRSKATGSVLFILFGTALLCTIGALTAFLSEVLIASRGIRADVVHRTRFLRRERPSAIAKSRSPR